MIRILKNIVLVLITTVIICGLSLPIYASSNGAEFTVHPVISDNQRGDNSSYFNLQVNKGEKQTLQVVVANTSNHEILIDVEFISASTTGSGTINYTSETVHDESLKIPFAEMATIKESQITIPAGENKVVDVDIEMPNKSFDGIILGSICITDITGRNQVESESSADEFSVEIRNEFEYVIAVMLQESDINIDSNFELGKVYTITSDNKQAIVADIRNIQPKLVKGLKYNANITSVDSNEMIYNVVDKEVSFAPNSTMSYIFSDDQAKEIPPGDYIFTGSITDGEKTWDFSKKITVDEQSTAEAKEAITQQVQSMFKGNSILFTIAMVTGVILVIVAVVLLVIFIIRKRRI